MLRLFVALSALFFATSLSAGPFDDLSDEDREALGLEIRRYLLENPELVREVVTILSQREEDAADAAAVAALEENSEALFNDGVSLVTGNPDGDITIVEFLDYQCSFCKRAHPEVAQLLESDGNIRLIQKEFPILGPMSEAASRATTAVLLHDGEEVYAEFSDRLMRHEGPLNEGIIVGIARQSGADADALVQNAGSAEVTEIIAANRQLGQALRITGTPTFIVVDEFIRGYLPLADMQSLIASKRAEM